MTDNIYWMKEDRKELWTYNGRLYRTEKRANTEYEGAVRMAKDSVKRAELYSQDPKYTYYYEHPERIEQAKQYLENVIAKKPRHITLVWD